MRRGVFTAQNSKNLHTKTFGVRALCKGTVKDILYCIVLFYLFLVGPLRINDIMKFEAKLQGREYSARKALLLNVDMLFYGEQSMIKRFDMRDCYLLPPTQNHLTLVACTATQRR